MGTPRPTALGAYIFAGGFTLGVKRHFKVQAVLEPGNYGVATMRRNQPEIPVLVGVDRWKEFTGPADFIYGNPPCAAWSPAGATLRRERNWREDARVDCTRLHFELLVQRLPKVWAWESVPQAFTVGRPFVDELSERARSLGYSVTYLIHNAMYLGCAQNRKRFFMVAHSVELDVSNPSWDTISCGSVLRKMNYVGELSPAATKLDRYDAIIPSVRPGEGLRHAWDRHHGENVVRKANGMIKGRPAFTIKRAHPDKPTGVVMNEMIHPTEDRFMTMQELAALCGFPPDYEFVTDGDMGQISRGVCPPVGEFLAKNVARAIRANVPVRKPTVTLVDISKPPGYRGEPPMERHTTMRDFERGDRKMGKKLAGPPAREDGEGSGAYIRRLLVAGFDADAILPAVHAQFPGSKATKSDVAWNRNRLRKEGGEAPAPKRAKDNSGPATRSGADVLDAIKSGAAPQPTRSRRTNVDVTREFDTTALKRGGSNERGVHRDYAAHFFRWGFAGRFCNNESRILDVGCGTDLPLVSILNHPRNLVPASYVGVDYNKEPTRVPQRQWATYHWAFDFTRRYKELRGPFSLITCFEVIEHMRPDAGAKLLDGIRWNLSPEGVALLSTPVFDGKAAANHLHEWRAQELEDAILHAGLIVEKRFGTFASWQAIKKVATKEELRIAERIREYYSGEVMACFLAPLYPDASRNIIWQLRRSEKKRRK